MRERVYFIGFKKGSLQYPFKWPTEKEKFSFENFLDTSFQILDIDNPTFNRYLNNKYNKGKFKIEDILAKEHLVLDWRQSDLRIYENKIPTLRNGRHGILYVKDGQLYKLSGYEGLLFQGFPKKLALKAKKSKLGDNKLLSQAGNAMTVNVVSAVAKELLISIGENIL